MLLFPHFIATFVVIMVKTPCLLPSVQSGQAQFQTQSLLGYPARLIDGNASENIVVLYVCFLITESNRCQLQN